MAGNYITTLRAELDQERRARLALLEGINDLEIYLASPKFFSDPYVNKSDVFARLRDALDAMDATANQ